MSLQSYHHCQYRGITWRGISWISHHNLLYTPQVNLWLKSQILLKRRVKFYCRVKFYWRVCISSLLFSLISFPGDCFPLFLLHRMVSPLIFYLFDFTALFYSGLIFPSRVFTAEFLNYVSFPREKEAGTGRLGQPVQAILVWYLSTPTIFIILWTSWHLRLCQPDGTGLPKAARTLKATNALCTPREETASSVPGPAALGHF